MYRLLLVVVISVFIMKEMAVADPNRSLVGGGRAVVRMCGEPLRELVNDLCDGIYAEGKRSDPQVVDSPVYNSFEDADSSSLSSDWDFLKVRSFANFFPTWTASPHKTRHHQDRQNKDHFSRNVRGLVSECCYSSCTRAQLMSYCGSTKRE